MKQKRKYWEIIVLDFEKAEVHLYMTNRKEQEVEDIIIEQGHSLSNCQWMVVPAAEFSINFHNVIEA